MGSSTASGRCCPGRSRSPPALRAGAGCLGAGPGRSRSGGGGSSTACAATRRSGGSRPASWSWPRSWSRSVSFAWPQRSSILRGPAPTSTVLVLAILFGQLHHGARHRARRDAGRPSPRRRPRRLDALISPGAVHFFRDHDHPIPVVLGEEHRLYELIGYANIYAQALPEARTWAEPKAARPGAAAGRDRVLHAWHVATPGGRRSSAAGSRLRDGRPARAEGRCARETLSDPKLQLVYTDPPDVPSTLGRFAILRVSR